MTDYNSERLATLSSHRVLYYHVIANTFPEIYPLGISVKAFEKQLIWLKRLGYNFIPLSKAVEGYSFKNGKSVSITLDDGFACNFEALMRIRKSYSLHPSLFLIGKCLDNSALAWNHKLLIMKGKISAQVLNGYIAELVPGANLQTLFAKISMASKDAITDALWEQCMQQTQEEYLAEKQPFFSSEQLAELLDSGAEIAAHSFSHPDFSRLSLAKATSELDSCFDAFETRNLPYNMHFAFPYGLRCSPKMEYHLMEQVGLDVTFGTRFCAGDNTQDKLRWQRQSMEGGTIGNLLEFWIKPGFRG
ncbi:MAG: polysaccharide deacetylase family protein [Candidatus Cloacimonas sp.]|jgi:peptidoglycan/xylan/chitin deacetylase (PgdA/CDA1 family)|nr:polysaccharide deacetylase family protein [Candidatus Cloacimonas sp.]